MRGAPFHQLGLGVEPVEWPLSQLEPQSEDVSTTMEKPLKKVLMGVQWYSVLSSQPQFQFVQGFAWFYAQVGSIGG